MIKVLGRDQFVGDVNVAPLYKPVSQHQVGRFILRDVPSTFRAGVLSHYGHRPYYLDRHFITLDYRSSVWYVLTLYYYISNKFLRDKVSLMSNL
jgi:hypothetical protein